MMDQVRVSRAAIGTHSECLTMQSCSAAVIRVYRQGETVLFCRCEPAIFWRHAECEHSFGYRRRVLGHRYTEIAHTMPDTQAVRVQPFRMARIFAKMLSAEAGGHLAIQYIDTL